MEDDAPVIYGLEFQVMYLYYVFMTRHRVVKLIISKELHLAS